jgi:hypothetical protein
MNDGKGRRMDRCVRNFSRFQEKFIILLEDLISYGLAFHK